MWVPIRCILSLDFTAKQASGRPNGDKNHKPGAHGQLSVGSCEPYIAEGSHYSGVSTIQYSWHPITQSGRKQYKDGWSAPLHFHATTTKTPSSKTNTKGQPAPGDSSSSREQRSDAGVECPPLVIEGMKINCPSRRCSMRIIRILEEDVTQADTVSGDRHDRSSFRNKSGKVKDDDRDSTQEDTWKSSPSSSKSPLEGSKYVFFEYNELLTEEAGVVVELVISFRGRVQNQQRGGVYGYRRGSKSSGTSAGATTERKNAKEGGKVKNTSWDMQHGASPAVCGADANLTEKHVLLTHFEVFLARRVFPCPDDPERYRIFWNVSSITLPSVYTLAVSNGALLMETSGGKQAENSAGTRTYGFAEVGPLPAYVIAFAAVAGGTNIIDSELPPFVLADRTGTAFGPRSTMIRDAVPLRVISATASGLSSAALQFVSEGVKEAVRLLEDIWMSPIPLSSFTHFHHNDDDHMSSMNHISVSADAHECIDMFVVKWAQSMSSTASLSYASLTPVSKLDVFIGPTPPFIAGMEHHGCIFLNHDLFQKHIPFQWTPTLSSAPSMSQIRQLVPLADLSNIASLIVHEVAHHWFGNAIGVPFDIKEGICQVVENMYGDTLLAKPKRYLSATAYSASGASAMIASALSIDGAVDEGGGVRCARFRNECDIAATTNRHNTTIESRHVDAPPRGVVQGKEFTFLSYQGALDTMIGLAMHFGPDSFEERLAAIVERCLHPPYEAKTEEIDDASEEETIQARGSHGLTVPETVNTSWKSPRRRLYQSADDFIRALLMRF